MKEIRSATRVSCRGVRAARWEIDVMLPGA
jgi:hypothetical protein